ncbi:uncharacterized protein LTHEOB_10411 [Lasiodiplodia theobromae]|uniref:uncharacterized protein n=1 Tax=Lasiodiplodia theobromae TaxID=45133 RepID=UPI0015C3F4A2|nr:uncharacterized protein LTHEOB_10411 [Lasiodiplodia theobromae]KAF4539247.1 hypothetical protein LTHEOB_10411 [Lasiodiplodia theobromae]
MSKLVVVVGATGGQGGGVVSAFLEDPTFKVRGITRNVDSSKAKGLTARGVEMVQADINDQASLDRAFQGAHIIFAVTDYYEHFFKHGKDVAMETETQYGTNLAKAAAKVPTLERYIWSTLPLTSALSQGKAVVPHFEGKGRVDAFIKHNLPELYKKTVFCIFTIFAENLTAYPIFKPVWLESAQKWIQFYPTSPDAPYASVGDHRTNTGVFVRSIVRNPPPQLGTYVKCGVEELTLESMLALWGRASGKAPTPGSTKVVQVSVKQYVELFGAMGEEQASQWVFFEWMKEAGVSTIPGVTMMDVQELMSDEEKRKLVGTEQALRGMDWTDF